jgi:hypothetical protein
LVVVVVVVPPLLTGFASASYSLQQRMEMEMKTAVVADGDGDGVLGDDSRFFALLGSAPQELNTTRPEAKLEC